MVAGSRLELGNGRRGTVVLTRSPLCVVCLDDDGDDAGVDDATLALRRMALRSGESGGEADAFMVGEMENSVDVTKLAGRVVDAFGCAVDGQGAVAGTSYKIFQEGLEQAQMAPIDEFVSVGVPAIDLMTPLGKGQSVLYVGPPEARSSLRRLALGRRRGAVPRHGQNLCGSRRGGNKRSQKRSSGERRASWHLASARRPSRRNARPSSVRARGDGARRRGHGAGEGRSCGFGRLRAARGPVDEVDINPGGAVWARRTWDWGRLGVPRVLLGRAAARGQHAGRRVADGRGADGDEPPKKEVLSTESYTLDQFRAAGARKSIMDRLEALDARGIAITDDILGKIGVAAPNTNKRPDAPGHEKAILLPARCSRALETRTSRL